MSVKTELKKLKDDGELRDKLFNLIAEAHHYARPLRRFQEHAKKTNDLVSFSFLKLAGLGIKAALCILNPIVKRERAAFRKGVNDERNFTSDGHIIFHPPGE